MDNSDLISVIIPTYGRAQYLGRAIDSVMQQTYQKWELIVVDDNEPDSKDRAMTELKMMKYTNDKRVKYIKHSKNLNGSAARNTGIQASLGNYIAFLDDDDEYDSVRLEKCLSRIKCQDNILFGAVYTGCRFFHNEKLYKTINKAPDGNFLVEALATTFSCYSGSNIFIKSNIIKELKGFDENFSRHQDYEFFVRYFEKYSLIGINEALLSKHENGDNLPNAEKMYKIKIQYINKYINIINSLNKLNYNYVFYSHYIYLALLSMEERKYKLFFLFTKKALNYRMLGSRDILRILKIGLLRGLK